MDLGTKSNNSVLVFKFSKEQKAVLSAVLQSRKAEGQVGNISSLSEAVNRSLDNAAEFTNSNNAVAYTTLIEIAESSENLKSLVAKHVPAKLRNVEDEKSLYYRNVKLAGKQFFYTNKVAKSFVGDWEITHKGKVVHRFSLTDSYRDMMDETFGTTLYQLATLGVKSVTGNELLNVKARGQLLSPGDFLELQFYYMLLLTPSSGKAFRVDLTLNFTNGEVFGAAQECKIQQAEKERVSEVEVEQEMSEDADLEIEDYDDYER